MARIFKTPFAAQGDKDVVPVPPQGDGSVSMTQGFGYDYEREYEDPATKDIRREIMNGLFHDLTEALGELQNFGFAEWQPVDGGWPVGATVRHADGCWQSLANANAEEPGAGALWKELLFGNLVPASETIRGVIQLAATAEAQALTNDTKALTPKKLADAFKGANQGLSESGYQKLPGGLIIQWGQGLVSNAGVTFPWPIAFPNRVLAAVAADTTGPGTSVFIIAWGVNQSTNTTGTFTTDFTNEHSFAWIAIGH